MLNRIILDLKLGIHHGSNERIVEGVASERQRSYHKANGYLFG